MKRVRILVLVAVVIGVLAVAVPQVWAQSSTVTPANKAAGRGGVLLSGVATEVKDNQLSVQTPDGVWKVTVTSSTVFRVPGVKEAALKDIPLNQGVRVQGRVTAVNALEATTIAALPVFGERPLAPGKTDDPANNPLGQKLRERVAARLPRFRAPQGLTGTIKAISGNTLTLTTANGEMTINVVAETRFRITGKDNATLADLKVGDKIAVVGRPDSACPVNAGNIVVLPERTNP